MARYWNGTHEVRVEMVGRELVVLTAMASEPGELESEWEPVMDPEVRARVLEGFAMWVVTRDEYV